MLKKLLKYDLKWVYKVITVFYVLSIIFAIITRVFFEIDDNSMVLIVVGKIFQGIAIAMIISALVNNFMRMWVRFKNNLYGDESYLTHTLPVKKNTIYLSKVLSAIITMFSTIFVGFLSIVIMYYSKENLEILKSMLDLVASTYDSTVIKLILTISVILFLEMLFVLILGYVALILGHKSSNGKVIKSIIYGFVLYLATQGLVLGGMFIPAMFNQEIMDLFTSSTLVSINAIKSIMYIAIAIYLIFIVVYYIIGKRLLKKGVNVD